MTEQRGQWSSRLGFMLAAAGSAIGLGSIWKFPYITGVNGGGLFVVIYLVCIALVGIPIMMAEIMIGRAAQKQPVAAFHVLQGHRTAWSGIGWLGVIAGFVILSYYVVVSGWAADYTLKSIVNFTVPIHDRAQRDAAAYIAATDVDELRKMLVTQRAQRDAERQVAEIRREAKPSVWIGFDRFQETLRGAANSSEATARNSWETLPTAEKDSRTAEVRRKLLTSPELADQVHQAEALMARIEEVLRQKRAEAETQYARLDEAAILQEAQDAKRREVTRDKVRAAFEATAGDGWTTMFWAALFMLATIMVVAGGVAAGIERTCKVLMPLLFALVAVMVVYGTTMSGFSDALDFVFRPDPQRLKASGVLEALGHAFFTLSLGMGAMITYGSYQQAKESLAAESAIIAVLDTVISLLACLMIFPITFSYGQAPSAGPGLVFVSMPLAFAEIGAGGMLLAILFFALLCVAALASAISLLEVVVSYFIDQRGWSRRRAAWLLGLVILAFGVPSAFSGDSRFPMTGWNTSYGRGFFDTMDYVASNWMLPLAGLLISIYAGWVMPRRVREAELRGAGRLIVTGWLLLIRFVAPVLVTLVLLQQVGFLDADELFHGMFGR